MVLEKLRSGALWQLLDDDGSRKLAFILCLPLIDGVFATLLVTGAVNTFSQMINVAITIFTGAGALAVLYAESDTRRDAVKMINNVVPVVVVGALTIALIAPLFEQIFNTSLLKYAAGLAILSIAAQLADIKTAEHLPPTAVIITGMLLSYQGVNGFTMTTAYVYPALATVGIAIMALYFATALKSFEMNLTYVRYGGSAVLVIIAASLIGINLPAYLGPLVFFAAILASFENLKLPDFNMERIFRTFGKLDDNSFSQRPEY